MFMDIFSHIINLQKKLMSITKEISKEPKLVPYFFIHDYPTVITFIMFGYLFFCIHGIFQSLLFLHKNDEALLAAPANNDHRLN